MIRNYSLIFISTFILSFFLLLYFSLNFNICLAQEQINSITEEGDEEKIDQKPNEEEIPIDKFSLKNFNDDTLLDNTSGSAELSLEDLNQDNFKQIAILQGLNKITAKTSEIKIKLGQEVEFGKLKIIAERCWKAPPEEKPENKILLKITDSKLNQDDGKNIIFYGWIFSSSPSISGLEHPIYDISAINCENEEIKK